MNKSQVDTIPAYKLTVHVALAQLLYNGAGKNYNWNQTMNTTKKRNGLSARQNTINRISLKIALAKRMLFALLTLAASLFLISCQQNNDSQHPKKETATTTTADSANKPTVNIKVNKHYDDKGNLIGMDSTYSSYYSNIKGDTARMDSLFHNFNTYFNSNQSSLLNNGVNNLFFNDSIF